LLMTPKPASDRIVATTNMANLVLIFMLISSFCRSLVDVLP
jgi:hypothetical protein